MFFRAKRSQPLSRSSNITASLPDDITTITPTELRKLSHMMHITHRWHPIPLHVHFSDTTLRFSNIIPTHPEIESLFPFKLYQFEMTKKRVISELMDSVSSSIRKPESSLTQLEFNTIRKQQRGTLSNKPKEWRSKRSRLIQEIELLGKQYYTEQKEKEVHQKESKDFEESLSSESGKITRADSENSKEERLL